MDILLIHPPLPANHRHKKVMPLGLAYLASHVRSHCPSARVEILDAHVLNMPFAETLEAALSKKRDIIGLSFWTAQAPFAYALAEKIREKSPETFLVFGGVHTSSLPQEAARFCDYCVLYEGEETFQELVEHLMGARPLESVKGVAYLKDGEFRRHDARPFIEDLDRLSFPAWDLLAMERYDTPLHVVGGRRVPVIGSRGCPYNCSFCVSPNIWGRKVRWRSPENVVSELKEIISKYGVRQFHFWDDNLLLEDAYIKTLCDLVIREKLDIHWVGLSRASHIVSRAERLPLLKAAGCVGLEVGIESADEKTFENIDKEESLDSLREAFCLQKKAGLYPLFTYMSLNPGETISTYRAQADLIDRLLSDLPWAQYFHHLPFPVYVGQFCTPHPGTKFFDTKDTLGMVLSMDWSEYNHHTVNFVPHSLLSDVPVRRKPFLGENDYILCVKAAWGWMYELYPDKQPFLRQFLKRCGFLYFVRRFFAFCDGRRTLKDVVEKIAKILGIPLKKSLQYAVITTIVLSQLGVLGSAVSSDGRLEFKKIDACRGLRTKWIYRCLRLASFFCRTY